MEVIHHGGKNTITGSCHELRAGRQSILIDCGTFQGEEARALDIDFPTSLIDALLLTHSHIDHIGRIPWLIADGFNQPIYCSKATAELVPLMLEDGLKIQLGLSSREIHRILKSITKLIHAKSYGEWFALPSKFSEQPQSDTLFARFQPAGHILGSAYIEIRLPNQEIVVFSGDLGPRNTPLLPDPQSPERADYLYIESTYGNSDHEDIKTRSSRLLSIINRSLADGGTILIPAFSIGRTQELLFDIEQLIHTHQLDVKIPIILDSPMAIRVTESYQRFKQLWSEEAKARLNMKRHPLAFDQCITIEDHRSHLKLVNRLKSTGEPAIVVAASGMCQGGRIMDYLKALLPDERTDVIIAGYQAEGTIGRDIQSGASIVDIDTEEVTINAHIHTMSGYSAHADRSDLLNFIDGITTKPNAIHLIHGEPRTQTLFAETLREKGYTVTE
ncbi:MBL fold metallo-hydrolase [Vibrio japonicus]|uniref:MBL fold metallo-hydrolase n=1 Tax=Vibrio japonicus TaxID=1824638 RepID=A0ABY5LD83_9VIBR|nr:MBL fold metallo-hydrolase [Vibrio japonicus]UUM29969.1 MBL fold metallo-hydrolase [Vibrio japonicus]